MNLFPVLAVAWAVPGVPWNRVEWGRRGCCLVLALSLSLCLPVLSVHAQSAVSEEVPAGVVEIPSAPADSVRDVGEGPINVVTCPVDKTILPRNYSLQLLEPGSPPDAESSPLAERPAPPAMAAEPEASVSEPEASVSKTAATPVAEPIAKPTAKPASKPRSQAKSIPSKPARTRVGPLRASVSGSVLTLRMKSLVPSSGVSWINLYAPKRLVIDLPGNWTLAGPNVVRLGAGPFKLVVVGEHAGKMRLVVHFVDEKARGEATPVVRPDAAGVTITITSGR